MSAICFSFRPACNNRWRHNLDICSALLALPDMAASRRICRAQQMTIHLSIDRIMQSSQSAAYVSLLADMRLGRSSAWANSVRLLCSLTSHQIMYCSVLVAQTMFLGA